MAIMNFGPTILRAGGLAFQKQTKLGMTVINKTGASIAVDKLVAITGYDVTSQRPKIVLADADIASHFDVWVTVAAIADGSTGIVYKGGMSSALLNTNSFATAGDPVYSSGTAGGFLVTPVSGSILVGFVVVKSATVGQIAWHIGLGQGNAASGGSGAAVAGMVIATMFVPAGAAAGDYDGRLFQADRPYIVTFVREQHQALGTDGGAVTLMVKKVPSATAKSAGTDILAAGINLKAANDTIQSPALHATPANYTLAAGDSLGLVTTGTLTAVDGVSVTVGLAPV